MAPAWLALIYVCRQGRRERERVRTEKNQPSSVSLVHVWSGICTMIWVSLSPKLSTECRISSKGVERMETTDKNFRWPKEKKPNTSRWPAQDLHMNEVHMIKNAHLLFIFHSLYTADVLCKICHLLQTWADDWSLYRYIHTYIHVCIQLPANVLQPHLWQTT